MAGMMTSDDMTQAIRREIQTRLNEMVEEETKKAQEAIAKRLKGELGQMALSILSHYEVQNDRHGLTITVKNRTGAP